MTDDALSALEMRVIDDPGDLDGWMVLADLLQKRGDPHGELIALQVAADRQPLGKKKTPAQTAFAKAFAKAAPKLIQPLVKHGASTKDPWAEPFVWRTGFVRRATIHEPQQRGTTPTPVQALSDLLALPAARFLTELSFRTSRQDEVHAMLDAIGERPPRALRELELIAHTHTGLLAAIWKALPRLRRIAVTANRFDLDGLELPEARRATFLTLGMTSASLAAIASAPWPHLERLEIRIGHDASDESSDNLAAVLREAGMQLPKFVGSSFEDIAPLLARSDLPSLTHLRIREASFAGGVLRALCESALAARLEVLDLSGGTLTPQDIKYASLRKAAFAQLRELWIPQITQWSGVAKDLEGMAKHVITKAPLDVFER